MGSTSAHNNEGLGRRDLIKRSAALGLITVPTMSFLSACACGGGGGDDDGNAKGKVSQGQPVRCGQGQQARRRRLQGRLRRRLRQGWEAAFDKKWGDQVLPPGHPGDHRRSCSRASTAATRRTSSTTPAPSRSSWTCSSRAASSPTSRRAGRALHRRPEQEGPGHPDRGHRRTGHSRAARSSRSTTSTPSGGCGTRASSSRRRAGRRPKTWDEFLAVCKSAKEAGIGGLAHQGKYPYYINVAIMDLIAKIGGLDAMKAIDNLEPKAFVGSNVAKQAVEAVYEVVEKGYSCPAPTA